MTGARELRIGVLGLGMRSGLAEYAHLPGRGSRVVACADPDPAARAAAAERFPGTALVSSLDELLEHSPDAVLVLTPDGTHVRMASALLRAGVATFVEKPMGITTEECDEVLRTAADTGTRLYVGHNMRHMPIVVQMRRLVREGAIGEVKAVWCRHFVGHGGDFYFKSWHADRRNSTSLLLQKGVHDLDVIHWLAGSTTRRVTAMGGLTVYGSVADRRDRSRERMRDWFDAEHNWPPLDQTGLHPVIDVEDLSMVQMQLRNGVFASYQQCHYTPDYWRNYTVIGTEGRLENFGDLDDAVIRLWNRRGDYRMRGDLEVEVPAGEGSHGGADAAVVAEFLAFVRNGARPRTSPVAARDAVATGCAATESLRDDGRPVDVPPVAPELAEHFGRLVSAEAAPGGREWTTGEGAGSR